MPISMAIFHQFSRANHEGYIPIEVLGTPIGMNGSNMSLGSAKVSYGNCMLDCQSLQFILIAIFRVPHELSSLLY